MTEYAVTLRDRLDGHEYRYIVQGDHNRSTAIARARATHTGEFQERFPELGIAHRATALVRVEEVVPATT